MYEIFDMKLVHTYVHGRRQTHQIVDKRDRFQLEFLSFLMQADAPPPVKHDTQKAVPTIEVPSLSLEELKEKTENFGSKALIGEGSYGRVYFANLNNGKSVAVKKLDVSPEAESNNEFLTQVSQQSHKSIIFQSFSPIIFLKLKVAMVSTLKHDNFVELCGYCVEGNTRVLAYEFATMGSLHDILHGISLL